MFKRPAIQESLFCGTLFVSAALLFLVQPMLGKMLLPVLGGAPAVWNTCMVFFQGTLLLGYAYANLVAGRLSVRSQVLLHLLVILLPVMSLPLGVGESINLSVPESGHPAVWLLGVLARIGGLPFFVLATTSPLLQRWFSTIGHPRASDPYFLYAASNFGSLLALLAFPLLIEPRLSTAQQVWLWTVGYAVFVFLVVCCASTALAGWWGAGRSAGVDRATRAGATAATGFPTPTLRTTVLWVVCAFVPSSLILGLTTYISTDVAAVPLMWVVPLALYLLSFVLVFGKKPVTLSARTRRLHGLFTLALTVALITDATQPGWVLIPIHFVNFLLAALLCHGTLASERPAPPYLTQFYFWISFGGVLGGAFNVFVAPFVFTRVFEYPVMLAASYLLLQLRQQEPRPARARMTDAGLASLIGLLTLGLVLSGQSLSIEPGRAGTLLMFGIPAIAAYRWVSKPARFGLSVLAILLASSAYIGMQGKVLYTERNFFGTLRVAEETGGRVRSLTLGTTIHGKQSLSSMSQCTPLGYFSAAGPAGDVFRELRASLQSSDVAVLGLGIGSTACFASPGQRWVFFEINPAVRAVAQDSGYFSLLRLSPARQIEVVLGDARLKLRRSPQGQFGLIVVDVFSSDAIPTHLYTREALKLYMSRLQEHGFVAFHVSNRFLDIKPVLAGIAVAHGWVIRGRDDATPDASARESGTDPSDWVVMARQLEDLGGLASDLRWIDLSRLPNRQIWTDDYTNIVRLFKWQ